MTFNLPSLGWDDAFADSYAPYLRPDHRPARVTRVDRGVCTILASDGPGRASLAGRLLTAATHDPVALPCTGDWVVVRTWPDGRQTLEAVLPRRTAVVRAGAGEESLGQVLAANLDHAAVVEPLDPEPDLGRIERLLALAWNSGARPLIILTKADLVADPAALVTQVAEAAPDIDVYAVSATTGAGVDRLRPLISRGRTLGLLGQSGAGKSTLVNALAGAEVMGTQSNRRGDRRGRHTTTYRALIAMPGGGAVLDTPGIRSVGLFADTDGVDRTFADIDALASTCRFADCGHNGEPGCAVAEALATGELAHRRFASWRKLHREVAHEMRRHDARLAAEERARHKRQSRDTRATRQRGGTRSAPHGPL